MCIRDRAVAPLANVRRVVDYAVSEIPPEKIDLGIPNYGYDWPLPFVRGETAATTIGNVEAVRLAVSYNAVIQFDETAQSPYFYYENEGITHEVWFEDVRSIHAKLTDVYKRQLVYRGHVISSHSLCSSMILCASSSSVGIDALTAAFSLFKISCSRFFNFSYASGVICSIFCFASSAC